jgi:iron complex transport system permease protein
MTISPWTKLTTLFALLLIIAVASLMIGYTFYSFPIVINCLLQKTHEFAINDVRLPRLIMAILCGTMFAFSGSLLQGIFRNRLASSETLGINAASILFVLLGITFFGDEGNGLILIYSVIGALCGFSITLVSSISRRNISHLRLIIVGVAISAFFRAASQFMLIAEDQKLAAYLAFVNGTLYTTTWHSIQTILYPALFLIGLSFCFTKQLDILLLSEDIASNIGFKVIKWKLIIIILALLLTAVAVAGVGSLGFIGLISPNISRLIFGYSHKYNLLGSALIGSILTILSDTIGRVILVPFEIPTGLIGIIIGVPYFLYIMRGMKQEA